MPDLRPIFLVIGILLIPLGLGMVVPAMVDIAAGHTDWQVFAISSFFTLFVGISLFLSNRGVSREDLSIKQAFLLTTLIWASIPVFAAFPFMFSELDLSFTDGYFESISGLTTTGATVLSGLDSAPPGLLLWRAILQWLGGIGIIVMAVAVLPMLRASGMQLFQMERGEASEKILPRMAEIAKAIVWIYLGLSLVGFAALVMAGMTPFDAIAHIMTAISTGGYSTSDLSIAKFGSAKVELILMVAMLMGSLPFVLYLQVVRGRPLALWRDGQVRAFFGIVALLVLVLVWWLISSRGFAPLEALRYAAFNTISIITTTGYATAPYDTWGGFALVFFLVIMFIGGCAGSTAGSIKIFRFQILFSAMTVQLKRLSAPHAVYQPMFGGRVVPEQVLDAVLGFFTIFGISCIVLTFALGLTGLDFVTSISAAAAAITNVGPGLGEIVGPAGTYAPLSAPAKWLLSFAMMAGRLELLTVLVLFTPAFWRS